VRIGIVRLSSEKEREEEAEVPKLQILEVECGRTLQEEGRALDGEERIRKAKGRRVHESDWMLRRERERETQVRYARTRRIQRKRGRRRSVQRKRNRGGLQIWSWRVRR
jgi:hypothetical protein